ncbi:MAG: hypothetical protein NTW36_04505 [Planctomycetia bacterium]|nr:hypothetical protein [Planctomycetia bacterium]
MKRENLGWLTAAGVLLLSCLMGAGAFEQVGRWQIASVQVRKGETGTVLLDTSTGEVMLLNRDADGSGVWQRISLRGLK